MVEDCPYSLQEIDVSEMGPFRVREQMPGKVNCETVVRELTNYMEGRVDPRLRARIDGHFEGCQNCKNLLATTRKMLQLVGDEKAFLAGLDNSLKESDQPPRPRNGGAAKKRR